MVERQKRLPVEETRRVLLQAGLELLLSPQPSGEFSLKLLDVVNHANRTTGSAYQIWRSQTEFRRDLERYVAESIDYADPGTVGRTIAGDLERADSLHDALELLGTAYFNYAYQRPELAVVLRLASITAPETAVGESVLAGYELVEYHLGQLLDEVIVGRGYRRYRDGVPIGVLSSSVNALTDGSALKARFAVVGDADGFESRIARIREEYIGALHAVVLGLTDPV